MTYGVSIWPTESDLVACILKIYTIMSLWCFVIINYPQFGASLVTQQIKNLQVNSAMQETVVWFLGWENPLIHSGHSLQLQGGWNYSVFWCTLASSLHLKPSVNASQWAHIHSPTEGEGCLLTIIISGQQGWMASQSSFGQDSLFYRDRNDVWKIVQLVVAKP